MLQNILLFVIGLILLIKGGDCFVDGATGVAQKFRLPDIIVGATVVSIGTTLPEVMVSAAGALAGNGAMAYGNAIGSIICNTALIAALSVACNPGAINIKTLKMPVFFFFVSAAIYCAAAYVLGEFPRIIGFTMLAVFILYMVLNIRHGLKNRQELNSKSAVQSNAKPQSEPQSKFKSEPKSELSTHNQSHSEFNPKVQLKSKEPNAKNRSLTVNLIMLAVGAAVIALGANLLVENGTAIAYRIGVPQTVISLTFVALGTSLPELITTITSLRKGHALLGIGNVIGANVFNLVLVSGVSVLLAPFKVPVGKTLFGHNSSLVLDIPLMITVMLILTVPALATKKLKRWQGITLLAIYAAFCAFQFIY